MKKNHLILFLLIILSPFSYSQDESSYIELAKVIQTNGAKSQAKMFIAPKAKDNDKLRNEFFDYESIKIDAVIEPASDDAGRKIDIFVVIRKQVGSKKTFYALDEDGVWTLWNGSLKSLPIYESIESASDKHEITIHDGTIEADQLNIYFGYSSKSVNDKPIIHFNSKPYSFTITDSSLYISELLFSSEPVVLENSDLYWKGLCGDPSVHEWISIQFVIPVMINDDLHDDFIIHYWCDSALVQRDDPTKDLLLAYISDSNGDYEIDNLLVFGDDSPGLGGASRKYVSGEFNGDGRPDFAFAMNWEDGRQTDGGFEFTNATESAILLSQSDFGYKVENPGVKNWFHAVDAVKQENGLFDFVFSGFLGSKDGQPYENDQAFRFDPKSNSIIDVSDEYPPLSPNSTRSNHDGEFLVLQSSGVNGEDGIQLFRKGKDQWLLSDEYYIPFDEQIDFIAWNGTEATVANVFKLNDLSVTGASMDEMCFMENSGITENPLLIAKFSGMVHREIDDLIETGNGVSYKGQDFRPMNTMIFFEIVDGSFKLLLSPIINEDYFVNANFFDCDDKTGDGFSDLTVSAFSDEYLYDRSGGAPVLYVNDGSGALVNADVSTFPAITWRDKTQGYLHDINNDGITDLVLFGLSTTYIGVESAYDIYIFYGK